MPQVSTRIEEYEALTGKVQGHDVSVVTYRLGGQYVCIIESVDVGAAICRVSGPSKKDVLTAGLSEAERLIQPKRSVPAEVENACEVYIDRIVMLIGEDRVAFTIEEFLALPMQERMQLILGGKLSFLDGTGKPIPVGEAIELLRSANAKK